MPLGLKRYFHCKGPKNAIWLWVRSRRFKQSAYDGKNLTEPCSPSWQQQISLPYWFCDFNKEIG